MSSVSDDVKQRQLGHFMKADPDYGTAVATKLVALAAC
jgi:catalase